MVNLSPSGKSRHWKDTSPKGWHILDRMGNVTAGMARLGLSCVTARLAPRSPQSRAGVRRGCRPCTYEQEGTLVKKKEFSGLI